MKYKGFDYLVKSADQLTGVVEGFSAVMGNVDRVKEIIIDGAMDETLAQLGGGVGLPMGWEHKSLFGATLGAEVIARNDLPKELLERAPDATSGLYTRGQTIMTKANRARLKTVGTKMGPRGLSIGYDEIVTKVIRIKGEAVTALEKIALGEWSIVKNPANFAAGVSGVKSLDGDPFMKMVTGSFEDIRGRVEKAIRLTGLYGDSVWVTDTFADHVIFQSWSAAASKYFSVEYSIEDDVVILGDPVEVDIVTEAREKGLFSDTGRFMVFLDRAFSGSERKEIPNVLALAGNEYVKNTTVIINDPIADMALRLSGHRLALANVI